MDFQDDHIADSPGDVPSCLEDLIDGMPDFPGRALVVQALREDRHLAVALTVRQLRLDGYPLCKKSDRGALTLAGNRHFCSGTKAESAFARYRNNLAID